MIYQSDYFDNCNGVIPQLVLSSLLLQAGNERAARYKNQLTTDNSQTTTFSNDGTFITINGILPLAESRYLISQPSLISRIGAINSENASLLSDVLGLPQAGFTKHLDQLPVTLPPGIENLSEGVLVLEKRLAYLVLLQEKRNRLIALSNYLHFTNLAGVRYDNLGFSRSEFQTQVCLTTLFSSHPKTRSIVAPTGSYIDQLYQLSEWVAAELGENNPTLIQRIDFDAVRELALSRLAELYAPPSISLPANGDVSSEITANTNPFIVGEDNGSSLAPRLGLYNYNYDDADRSPFKKDSPDRDYSPLTNDKPDNTLPEC